MSKCIKYFLNKRNQKILNLKGALMVMTIRKCFANIVLLFFLILSTNIPTFAEEAIGHEKVKLKVLLLPYLSFAPFFIAEEEGFFAEQGLEIEFVRMSEGTGALPLVIQGDLDVGTGTIGINLLNAITRGGLVKIVADKGHIEPEGCPVNGILVRREIVESAGDASLSDRLRGKRISLNPISTDGYYVAKGLKMIGLSLDEVQTRDLLIPPMRAKAIESGAIDIVHASEPWITRILKMGNATLLMSAKDIVPHFQYAVIIYGPTLLKDNRSAGRGFMLAYLKAVRQYNQGKTARNLEILAKHTGVELELLKEVCWPAIRNSGQINAESVIDFQNWGRQKGFLDKVVDIDQFWDPSFIK
jgi:NitT/TauT family transport system substrate-binding protein